MEDTEEKDYLWTVESLAEEVDLDLQEKNERYKRRLIDAHESFVRTIESKIKEMIRAGIMRGRTDIIIVDPHNGADMQGYAWMTIQYGHFNRPNRTYSRTRHLEAGIKVDPLQELRDRLGPRGVKSIEDISDRNKGFSFVIKVSW